MGGFSLGSIFGGGSSNVTSSSSTNLPKWAEEGAKDIFESGKGISDRPYPIYGDPRVAGFNPDHYAAFDAARGTAGSWAPFFERAAMFGESAAAPIGEADISRFMNPWTQQVVDRTTAEIARQAGRQRLADNAAMSNRGSFMNETRRGVVDVMREEAANRAIGDASANLYREGFGTALGAASQQKQREHDASNLFNAMAAGRVKLGEADVANLLGVAEMVRNLQQQGMTINYEDFLNEFYFPQDQLAWLQSILSGVPMSRTTTSQTPVADPNYFAQILGGGTAIGGVLGDIFDW